HSERRRGLHRSLPPDNPQRQRRVAGARVRARGPEEGEDAPAPAEEAGWA
ncbi:hypothetical protein V493_07999, partial [Pseudogymnoascus sp. VKM F-4281 (FW-2241)]